MRTAAFVFLTLLSINSSCKKEKEKLVFYEGIIRDYGSPSVDGCGWMIKIDGIDYMPVNLSERYRNNGRAVILAFKVINEKYECGFPARRDYEKIKILKIKAK